MHKQSLRYYDFGPFRLNVTERLLQTSDRMVPLTPKLIDTLVVLVENSGHVVTKDSLMRSLWPDTFVEESSLTQNISLLRKALAEGGGGEHYIETIPKRGYRFAADVREHIAAETEMVMQERTSTQILIEEQLLEDSKEPAPLPATDSRRNVLAAPQTKFRLYSTIVAGSLVLVSVLTAGYWFQRNRAAAGLPAKSIAVLPFKTIGPQTESELMGLGMADALILKLSRLDQPAVLPTSSISKFTNRNAEAASIGRELGVDAVLDGTVQRDGDRVRVTAQLIRSSDGKPIWSGKFDEDYRSIFMLQDAISEELAAALIPHVAPNKQRLNVHLTENQEAYRDYLTGVYFWNRRTKVNLPKAIEYFEQAVKKDPNFALAHAYLGDSYFLAFQTGYEILRRDEALTRAGSSVRRALDLDDNLPEAHTVKAGILLCDRNYAESEREYRRALELNHNYAVGHLRYGYFLFYVSRLPDALLQMRRAQELDPVSPIANAALGHMLYMSRDYDGSIKFNKRALELQPDVTIVHLNLGEVYAQKGMFEEALAEFEKVRAENPQYAAAEKAYVFGLAGRRSEALNALEQLRQLSDGQADSFSTAVVYCALGEKDKAFEWLEKVSPNMVMSSEMRFDPRLDSLRGDPRFDDYLKRRSVGAE